MIEGYRPTTTVDSRSIDCGPYTALTISFSITPAPSGNMLLNSMSISADFADDDYRVIQFTPPGSGCSVISGKKPKFLASNIIGLLRNRR